MIEWAGKRYWLVGASEGLGAALAQIMARAGVELVLSARNEDRLQEVANTLPRGAKVVPCDVTSSESVAAARAAAGDLDGVVFLAGVYWPMSAQDWKTDDAVAMADVNFTGMMRVLGAVVPDMVAKDQGHVVITGSLSGFRGLPKAIGYGASKAATMSLAETMYADLRKTGVKVQLANPGFIRTRLTDKNDFKMPSIMEPEAAAQAMFEHMNTDQFKTNFPAGFSLVLRAMQFLPDWLYYRLVS